MFPLAAIPKIEARGVYAIRCAGGVYVGHSTDIYGRLRDHRKTLRGNRHRSTRLQRAYDALGEASFTAEVLAADLPLDREILALVEQEFMDSLGANLNKCPSSASRAGCKTSARGRANIAAAQRRRFERQEERDAHGARLRVVFSDPEIRAKCGDGRRGKKFGKNKITPEGRAALAAARKAEIGIAKFGGKRNMSAEHIENLRLAGERRRGRPSPKKGKPGKPCSEETKAKMRAAHAARLKAKGE